MMIILIIVILLAIIGSIIEFIIEKNVFITKTYKISNSKIEGESKIAILADLHNTSYGKDNIKLIKKIIAEKPNYIFIAGDMMVHRETDSVIAMQKFLLTLQDTLYKNEHSPKIIYAFGNHEKKAFRYEKVKNQLEQSIKILKKNNIIFLLNDKIDIENNVNVAGLDIDAKYFRHTKKYELEESLLNLLPSVDTSKYNILLSHHPGIFVLSSNNFDLTISAHLHAGMIWIPLIGGVILTGFPLKRKYAKGIYKDKNTKRTLLLSGGLGDHLKSFRFNNKAEIIMLTLSKD